MTRHLEPDPHNLTAVWEDALKSLREECPPRYPVWVVRKKLNDQWGYCEFDEAKGRFLIVLNSTAHPNFMLDLLIHEWAHAMDWFSPEDGDTDHPASWGVAYARAYTAVMWR